MTSSNPLLDDLAAIRALHDKASQHHEAVDYYSLVLAIRKMLPEIERLTRELEHTRKLLDAIRPADETSEECRWTQIGSSQWKYGCAVRYVNGNIDDMRYCPVCGKPIRRAENGDGGRG